MFWKGYILITISIEDNSENTVGTSSQNLRTTIANYYELLNIFYMINTIHALFHLVPITTMNSNCYFFHFKDEETKVWKA